VTVTLRYWAAAAAATGVDAEEARPDTVAAVLDEAVARHPELGRVLQVASVLVDGTPVRPEDRAGSQLSDGVSVEILPPFAGG